MKIPYLGWVWPWGAVGVLIAAVGVQQLRVSDQQAALAKAEAKSSEENAQRWSAALAFQQMLDKITADHAAEQQQAEDAYHAQIAQLETDRARRAADNQRMRGQIDEFTAGVRRPGESDAVALQRATDRLRLVGSLLAEGAELVTESIDVVARRDADVGRLQQQIKIDRAACSSLPSSSSAAAAPVP